MRTLSGMVLGIVLTIGIAWWADSSAAPGEPRMVDWHVVGQRVQEAQVRLKDGWNSLTARLDRNGSGASRTDGAT